MVKESLAKRKTAGFAKNRSTFSLVTFRSVGGAKVEPPSMEAESAAVKNVLTFSPTVKNVFR